MMKGGLYISVLSIDPYLDEIRVRATNGVFSGQADILIDVKDLAQLAEVVRGFPTTADDVREFLFGDLDETNTAGGGVRLRLYCVDKWGHVAVEVTFLNRRGGHRSMQNYWDKATFHIETFQPAQIDLFVNALNNAKEVVGPIVSLEPD